MEWIETQSGNRISKAALIKGSDHILIAGNTTVSPNVILNGDARLTEGSANAIQLGKFCFLGDGVVITPPLATSITHRACKLGSYTMIGAQCEIRSSSIGTRVEVGSNCKLQDNSIVHDCVIIKPNTTIPEQYTVPPFSLVSLVDNILHVDPLPESYKKVIELNSKLSYLNNQFIPSVTP